MIAGANKTPEMRINATEIGLALDPSNANTGKQTAVRLIWTRQSTPIGASLKSIRLQSLILLLRSFMITLFYPLRTGHPASNPETRDRWAAQSRPPLVSECGAPKRGSAESRFSETLRLFSALDWPSEPSHPGRDPSPGPRRLVKAPSRSPSPLGRGL